MDRVQWVSILGSALLLGGVLELVRARKLMEQYSLVWIFTAVILLLLSCWRGLLDRLALITDVHGVIVRLGPFLARLQIDLAGEPALSALGGGGIDTASLIAARFPLRDAAEALRVASRPGMLKVLIESE